LKKKNTLILSLEKLINFQHEGKRAGRQANIEG
jgi:hypothetical protein